MNAARPISVKLDPEIKARIDLLAQARQRSAHWMMREAIQQYVEREEKQEAYRQAGMNAWNEYQTTGQHVTMEEADDWLEKLEAGDDVEPPECHV